MVSVDSVKADLAEASGNILLLMQQMDDGEFFNIEWSDEMFDAYELVSKAVKCLGNAQQLEHGGI